MALRYVKDLNPEQWAFLVKCLKEGPTPEQRQFVQECIERFRPSNKQED